MNNEQTYVHEGVEVKKTGRTAEKDMPANKKAVLFEITPADPDNGTWKKWVSDKSLFSIVQEK